MTNKKQADVEETVAEVIPVETESMEMVKYQIKKLTRA